MSINSSNFHPAFNFQEAYDRHPCEVGKEKSNLDDLHPASSNFFLYHTDPLYNMEFSMVSKDSNLMLIENLATGLVKKGFKEEVVEAIAKKSFPITDDRRYPSSDKFPARPLLYNDDTRKIEPFPSFKFSTDPIRIKLKLKIKIEIFNTYKEVIEVINEY